MIQIITDPTAEYQEWLNSLAAEPVSPVVLEKPSKRDGLTRTERAMLRDPANFTVTPEGRGGYRVVNRYVEATFHVARVSESLHQVTSNTLHTYTVFAETGCCCKHASAGNYCKHTAARDSVEDYLRAEDARTRPAPAPAVDTLEARGAAARRAIAETFGAAA